MDTQLRNLFQEIQMLLTENIKQPPGKVRIEINQQTSKQMDKSLTSINQFRSQLDTVLSEHIYHRASIAVRRV
jgi:hypothetical protein